MIPLLTGALSRIRSEGVASALAYTLQRFSAYRSLWRRYNGYRVHPRSGSFDQSLFSGANIVGIVDSLKREAFSRDLNLPDSCAENIKSYANSEKCTSHVRGQKYEYPYWQKGEVERKSGQKFILGHYGDSARRCAAIRAIEGDPLILAIATRYLGKFPKRITSLLWWSYAVNATEEERLQAKQTILFHYDLETCFSVYFNFYLTDVDSGGGPHVLVRQSHKKKSWKFLLSSANQSDQDVFKYYGRDNIVTLCDQAGSGFVEDPFCLHKATAPKSSDRLLLQIRMGI